MKRLARDLALFLLGLLSAIVIASFAQKTELQLEYGQCRFDIERYGTFQQPDRYTANYLTPRCASLGLAGRFGSFLGDRDSGRWGWRVALVVSGTIQARGNVATLYDDEAGRHDLACGGGHADRNLDGRGCLARETGSGDVAGFSVSLTRAFSAGPIEIVPEAGLFFFRSRFHNHPTLVDCGDCNPQSDYDAGRRLDIISAPPDALLGAAVRRGSVYLAVRRYLPLGHRALSLTDNAFTQIAAGLALPFGGKR